MTRRTRYVLDLVVIAVAYFALARLGLLFTLPGTKVSLVWLPAGIALAALLVFGASRWPAIALGELALMASLGYGPPVGLVAAAANAVQALVGTHLLTGVMGLDRRLERQRDVLGLLAAALVSAAAGATLAVLGFGLIGRFPWQTFAGVWRSWWLGDVIGMLLVTPVALTWFSRPRISGRQHRVVEAGAMAVVLFAAGWIVFLGVPGPREPVRVLPYVTFPILIWSALRFQQRGATTVVLLLSGFAIWGTAHGYGPLVRATPAASLLDLDGFVAVAALTTMLLAAAVAERQRTLLSLRESETGASAERERFRALVEHGSDAIAVTDAEARLLYVSPSVTRILGYAPEELTGQRGLPLVHPEDRAGAEAMRVELARRPGGHATLTLRARHRDGSWRHLEVETANRLDEPSVGGFVSNFRDVTDRKRLEEQLLASQRLEAVGRLAGGVAHDFNNILTAILGHSELLREGIPADGPAAEGLREIRAAATRATTLTQQLLAFSRNQILQPRVLDPNALLRDLDKMLRPLVGEDIELVLALDPATERVRADPGQLEQAIVSLVLNARDAMPDGGRVTLATANAELPVRSDTAEIPVGGVGPQVMLAVTDTGVGMDAEFQARIFEPFFTTKERGKGTGLGLATVYGMVRQSGGHIAVESAPGRGSVFRLYLPAVLDAVEDAPRRSGPTAAHGTETILLVEDNPSVRSVARRILTRFGYTVLEAADGEAALGHCRAFGGRIDLLVSDLVMPGMSGRRVAEEVSLVRPEVKLLFMSGYTDDAIVRHGVGNVGIPFLQKPFTVEELAGKVREVLDS
ncbi:MAG: MASE1 domain-containing protein [Gemmatimonadota bacterium]